MEQRQNMQTVEWIIWSKLKTTQYQAKISEKKKPSPPSQNSAQISILNQQTQAHYSPLTVM